MEKGNPVNAKTSPWSTWEVYEWWNNRTIVDAYDWYISHKGNSLLKAIWVMIKLKRNGASCLKLEWRRPDNNAKKEE
jgi:hypothetical protein